MNHPVCIPFTFRKGVTMKKKYKLIDRNLIRSFGKISVTLDATIGERFVREGKARPEISHSPDTNKAVHGPPSHKAIFYPPEEKSFEEFGEDYVRYPGPGDKLFAHIVK